MVQETDSALFGVMFRVLHAPCSQNGFDSLHIRFRRYSSALNHGAQYLLPDFPDLRQGGFLFDHGEQASALGTVHEKNIRHPGEMFFLFRRPLVEHFVLAHLHADQIVGPYAEEARRPLPG